MTIRIGAHVDQADPVAEARARGTTLVQFFLGDPQGFKGPEVRYPGGAAALRAAIGEADGIVIASPEYNHGMPGVLKNAIDLGSRPYGHSAFAGKPAAVIGASIGVIGTALAQQHLRNILSYLDMPVLGQPEAFIHFKEGLIDAQGTISNEGTRDFLQGFVDRFLAWIATHGGQH